MAVTVFNIKRMPGKVLRFSLKFFDASGMPLIKAHGWRLMGDDSLVSPSTYWGGRNNAMTEIPAWEVQKTIIEQVRALEAAGGIENAGVRKKRPKYKLPRRATLDESDYRKPETIEHDRLEFTNGGMACMCYFNKAGVWTYAPNCPCHEDPETNGNELASKEVNQDG